MWEDVDEDGANGAEETREWSAESAGEDDGDTSGDSEALEGLLGAGAGASASSNESQRSGAEDEDDDGRDDGEDGSEGVEEEEDGSEEQEEGEEWEQEVGSGEAVKDEEESEEIGEEFGGIGAENSEERPPRRPGRVRFDQGMGMEEDPLSDRQHMIEAQLSFWGNSLVMFSSIGIGLYVASKIFSVDFERFLGMVMLGGFGMLASRPRYNPNLSQMIEHGLTEGELETIRTFAKRRVDLQTSDWESRDEILGRLKRSSYSNVGGASYRRGSRDSYEKSQGQNYFPAPEPFESMLSIGGEEGDGIYF